jgi:adenine-specific DNA-methyltransferase
MNLDARLPDDTAAVRKARGAFFTPDRITDHIAKWALRSADDSVLEPSAGDAAFLVAAVRRLSELGMDRPQVDGIEIHQHSAEVGEARVKAEGGLPRIVVSDFFLVEPHPRFDAVIGNPPFVRYQEWSGDARVRSRQAALAAGVALTGLASSWAAFTIQSALHLRRGGRLGLVLPAELLSVNYAAPVREFLFNRFSGIELVLFEKQIFQEAEADTLLLLASGFGEGPTDHAVIRQVYDADDLGTAPPGVAWTPEDPAGKWIGSTTGNAAMKVLKENRSSGTLARLDEWGDTTLGMVTGNNRYFALSPARVAELGLSRTDVIPLSPPGSSHLRGLALTRHSLTQLGDNDQATWLFRPADTPSQAAIDYITAGEVAGISEAYKCRVRTPWWRVPLQQPADLLLTYMNADAARLVTNAVRAHHVNSVHGVYLHQEVRATGTELLPVASLNSATMLSAESVGRSYGGGILKIEPREADQWLMPSPSLVLEHADELRRLKPRVRRLLRTGRLAEAVALVDAAILAPVMTSSELTLVRAAHLTLQSRRSTRGKRGGRVSADPR